MLLRKLHILSIDVALGAAALAFILSRIWKIEVPAVVLFLLAAAVWLIYTLDHIKDAFETNDPDYSARRKFHRKHYRQFLVISILLILLCSLLLFSVNHNLLLYGAVLSGIVCAFYLFLHLLKHNARWYKEVVIAILYTAGIVLGPTAYGDLPAGAAINICQLFLLALTNLLLFSWFDAETDKREGFPSMIQLIGERTTHLSLIVMITLQVFISLFLVISGFEVLYESVWMVMCLLLVLPVFRPVFWQRNLRYRILGDIIFFLPLILLF